MNDAQAAPGASLLPDSTDLITGIHFGLIALFALAAVAIILIGIRRKRRRRHAEHVVEERIEAAEQAPPPVGDAGPAPVAPPSPAAPAQPVDRVPPVQPARTALPAPLVDEPIAAASAGDASPAAEATPDPVADAALRPAADDPGAGSPEELPPAEPPLTDLKGLGPKVAARLADLGIGTVGRLAALSPAEAEGIDAQLGPFAGRMARDRWIEQARFLAAGDREGFEAVFGRL